MRPVDKLPNRKQVRLPRMCYRSGTFFITICTQDRRCTLGRVVAEAVELLPAGRVVDEEWRRLVDTCRVRNAVWVVMPNHFHALFELRMRGPVHAPRLTTDGPLSRSVGALVGLFKARVSARARRELGINDYWQRGYHEHVVRNEDERVEIEKYIVDNPRNWPRDREHPGGA